MCYDVVFESTASRWIWLRSVERFAYEYMGWHALHVWRWDVEIRIPMLIDSYLLHFAVNPEVSP